MSINVIESLKKGLTIRETGKVVGVSKRSVMKVKKMSIKQGILAQHLSFRKSPI